MPKRSRTTKDVNQIAHAMVEMISTGQVPPMPDGKNPIAVALGRLGGLKGGKARAAKMTAKERSEGARNAAKARWSEKENSQ